MMADQPVECKRTYCRVCMVHCGLIAEVAGDRIVRVRGDPDHPLSAGYPCPKCATGRLHHHPDAITSPMMRKDGELVPVSREEALDDIGARLRALIGTHGPYCVGIYFGSGLGLDSSGYAMEEALHQALGGPPKFSPLTIDGTAKVMIAGAMGAFPWLDAHIQRIGGWKLMPPKLVGQWEEMRHADEASLGQPRPLCFSSRRQRDKFNAQFSFLGEVANILLHPEDAAARGITDGQQVRVHNASGAILLEATVDRGMRWGVVSIPHGHAAANVNHLTSTEDVDPLGGMAPYSGVPVGVDPV